MNAQRPVRAEYPRSCPKVRRRSLRSPVLGLALACLGLAAGAETPETAPQETAAQETSSLGLLEAVVMTLENDPTIALVESRLEGSRGSLLVASGRFDSLLEASLDQSDTKSPTETLQVREEEALAGALSLSRELRGGLLLTPSVSLERSDDGSGTVNTATVAFTLRQPLLRDRGRAVVTADERAAERELEAARYDLEHQVAVRLLAVTSQYWVTRAAMLDLEVLNATEASSRELLETTRRLIAADLTPAAEVVQLEADLASREASRIAGERAVFRARQDLGREIGLEPGEIAALPPPGEGFPTVAPEDVPSPEDASRLFAGALVRRADLRAAGERRAAAQLRRDAAQNALAPRLDLVFTPSASGLVLGSDGGDFFAPLVDNVPGLSATLGLSLSWPVGNRRAEGALVLSEASLDQERIGEELIEKALGAEVPAALDAVRATALQLERVEVAVGFFEEALDNEVKKLRAGSSTLVDVITQRDRLTAIQRQRVSVQLALALALAELRFTTGTLLAPGGDATSLTAERLTTVPED